MAKMMLYGGAQDGWVMTMTAEDRPDIFFALPPSDEELVKKTKGNQAKLELRDKLATLAYKFDPKRSTPETYRMYRCADLDKVRAT